MDETATLLEKAGWGLSGYHSKARLYRLSSSRFPNLMVKIFHEKDIPVQVAVGNYDLGICGLDWIEELSCRYPSSSLVKLKNLQYGQNTLYMATSESGAIPTITELKNKLSNTRIVSEYPNLAQHFASNLRLRKFSIFPIWGAAEAYPPESSDLALVSAMNEADFTGSGLLPVNRLMTASAFLIANKSSWESKDLGYIVASINNNLAEEPSEKVSTISRAARTASHADPIEASGDIVRLALPDGHQQAPTQQLLTKAGIQVDDYPSQTGNRRPTTNLPGVSIKVIRPQDMPQQVANNNFDLAVTGRDWLTDHLYMFPSSPVKELVDLKSGKVRIVAVVSNELAISNLGDLRQFNAGRSAPIRIASEYINIADKFARDKQLGPYRIIPTWGATEAFLPEDADLLIENTETGSTIARHNLHIINTLFESTACLISRVDKKSSTIKNDRIQSIIDRFQKSLKDA